MSLIALLFTLARIAYFAWKYAPEIAAMVREIAELIKKIRQPQDAAAYTKELQDAAEHYKKNKDSRRLHRLRDRLQKRCFGPDCEPPSAA